MPSDVKNDGTIPKAYGGFKYCSFEKPKLEEGDGHMAVLCIKPIKTNNIFAADKAPGMNFKDQCFEVNSEEIILKYEGHLEYQRCPRRTLVPIHKYRDNYEKSVVLIDSSRVLSFDEVEIIDIQEIPDSVKQNNNDNCCVIC